MSGIAAQKRSHLQFHALFCQDMYLSFHSPVPIPSSVRTHEQGKVSVHSGLSSMLNDKKSWCFWGCTWCSTFCTYIIGVIYCRPRFLWFRSHILPRMFFPQTCKDQRYTGSLFEHHLKLISCRLLVPLPNMPIKITAPQSGSAKSIYSTAGSYGRFLSLWEIAVIFPSATRSWLGSPVGTIVSYDLFALLPEQQQPSQYDRIMITHLWFF